MTSSRMKTSSGCRTSQHKSRNWKNWFTAQIPVLRVMDRKRKYGECDLDLRYLVSMLIEQNRKCAITGMEMTHNAGDPCACSIDRLDDTKAHCKGNVRLTCQWVNYAMSKCGESKFREVLTKLGVMDTSPRETQAECMISDPD